jgi:hypothetical protein
MPTEGVNGLSTEPARPDAPVAGAVMFARGGAAGLETP